MFRISRRLSTSIAVTAVGAALALGAGPLTSIASAAQNDSGGTASSQDSACQELQSDWQGNLARAGQAFKNGYTDAGFMFWGQAMDDEDAAQALGCSWIASAGTQPPTIATTTTVTSIHTAAA